MDGKIVMKKRERISKNKGDNPEWAKPARDCPQGFLNILSSFLGNIEPSSVLN